MSWVRLRRPCESRSRKDAKISLLRAMSAGKMRVYEPLDRIQGKLFPVKLSRVVSNPSDRVCARE